MVLQPFEPWPFFSFLILYTVGRTPWTGVQPVARLLPTPRTTQAQNKRTQTSMPRVGFELTTPVFERPKTVHAWDCDRPWFLVLLKENVKKTEERNNRVKHFLRVIILSCKSRKNIDETSIETWLTLIVSLSRYSAAVNLPRSCSHLRTALAASREEFVSNSIALQGEDGRKLLWKSWFVLIIKH
jgi:hypothetical protein